MRLALTMALLLLARDLTLEQIDLLWATEEFRKARSDLPIFHHTALDTKEGLTAELKV